ncbi:ATP-binding protein [Aetokthonos hydrillicola Thurmond2011]|jgi:signal transduction histidine kinase|uniref:histidine kinase n=1 Tax=Aetokthonos hydrillicola Thurmond2011 TaxID=2712845 RepID=A0AAP5I3Y2_9CYAN|nr:ATP-binding protein [Aetokthonos hydrillicola]MBO3458561.1 hybrid sensor histidine kinase/response regulator [Aetokthonos hydrillicola CCALA 1050]MBW4585004.1 response regulator [Aetokthonos hydrillicola CCALA 1050]MDR9894235.1 ATP-binding protein [Aetokthonos hydrillicola Thurmond2011]
MKEKILVVEDEGIIACDIKYCLEKSGYTVPAIAAYGEQAIEKASELHPDLVLMDIMLKGNMSGIEAADQIISNFNIPVIYLTAYSDEKTLKRAKITQPFGYILKPFEEMQLITAIEIALSKYQEETLIRKALEKEKEMRELNSQFISMVSHEFRNPLSTILTSTELLTHYSQKLNEEKKSEYINHIQNAVKQMNQLMTDVLTLGKTEIGHVNFNPVEIDLEQFCSDLVAEIQLSASENHKIIFTTQENTTKQDDATVIQNTQYLATKTRLPCLDEKLLRHILSNLLLNAIKYSPHGGVIHFELFCLEEEAIFRIQDHGIGIPETDQDNLFNSFHRGSNVGKIPGHGLGLAIVKQYVELHGGEITFASKVGVGTTFVVSLPFHKRQPENCSANPKRR